MGTKNNPGDFDCYEHADPDEPIFTLLARDRIAPQAVRAWASWRETALRQAAEQGNATAAEALTEIDQIAEARACADAMEEWREENRR